MKLGIDVNRHKEPVLKCIVCCRQNGRFDDGLTVQIAQLASSKSSSTFENREVLQYADLAIMTTLSPSSNLSKTRRQPQKASNLLYKNWTQEIIVKSVSGILLLLLKHFKINHIYQEWEYWDKVWYAIHNFFLYFRCNKWLRHQKNQFLWKSKS